MAIEEMENLLVELTESVRSRYFGKYRGIVKQVDDPDKLGRIIAQVPEIYGDEVESPWALPAVPFAGKDHGFVAIPETDDGVWIEFEAGDISRPIWTGCWWGDDELPSPGGTQTRVFATTAGHKLVLDDEGGEVQLLHSGGAEVKMTDDEISVTIGQSEATLANSGEITLKVGSTEITLTQTELTLKSGPAQIKLSSAGVDINNGAIKVL